MKLETKYNVGDEVWGINKLIINEGKWSFEKFVIKEILITIGHKGIVIEYLGGSPYFYNYLEEDCFPTSQEAEAECIRRNR